MADYNLGTARGVIEVGYNSKGVGAAKKDVKSLDQTASQTKKGLDKAAKGMAIAGGVIAGGFAVALNSAASFEAQMSAIKAVSGATTEEMQKVNDKALQLGKDTKFSAAEAGQAMEELVKAGIKVPDVLNGAADAVVALAAAGEIALPEAATIAANAMNQFGLAAKDMPHVADLIAGAANASAIDVQQFGMSLSQAGAVANLVGLSFDDLSVAIAEMGNAGIKSSDAGTSIKTFLSNLIPTTDQQIALFRELGFLTVSSTIDMQKLARMGIKPLSKDFNDVNDAIADYVEKSGGAKVGTAKNNKATQKLALEIGAMSNNFFDAAGKAKSLGEMQALLAEKTKGMSQEQKLATFNVLFGSDAIRAASVLANEGAAGYDKMSTAMGKVSAADVAKTRMDNLKGSLEQLKGSLETASIQLGQVLLPSIRKVVNAVTGLINKFISLSPQTQKLIVQALAATAGLLLMGAGFIKMVNFAKNLTLAFKSVHTAMKFGKDITIFAKALNFLKANPIILIISAVVLLGLALVALYKKSATFRAIVQQAFSVVGKVVSTVWKSVLKPIFDALKIIIPIVGKAMMWLWKNVIVPAWEGIKAAVAAAWPFIKVLFKLFQAELKIIGAVLVWLWQNVIVPAFNAIKTIISAAWTVIKPILTLIINIFKVIGTVVLWLWQNIIAPAFQAIGFIITTAWGIISAIFNVIIAVVKIIGGVFLWLWQNVVQPVWNGIKTVITTVAGVISSIFNVIKGAIRVLGGVFSWLWKNIIAPVWSGIKGAISTAWKFIKPIFDAIKVAAKKIGDVFAKIAGTISKAWEGISNVVKGVINGIIGGINSIIRLMNKIQLHVHMPDWLGGAGFDWNGFNLPEIPQLWTGGTATRSGMAMVGERGPELLNMPKGASVIPLQGGEAGNSITINNYGLRNEKPSDANARQLRSIRATGMFVR